MRRAAKRLANQCEIRLGTNLKNTLGLKGCPLIRRSMDIAVIFKGLVRIKREVLVAGALDIKCRLIRWSIVAIGSSHAVSVRPGDVFQDAISSGAMGIVLVHNHPSGSLRPSKEDRELTRQVKEAGWILGYPLLDHVIVARSGYRSLMPDRIENLCLCPNEAHIANAAKRPVPRQIRDKPKSGPEKAQLPLLRKHAS